eukprot:2713232-Rhodomonas_salina.2
MGPSNGDGSEDCAPIRFGFLRRTWLAAWKPIHIVIGQLRGQVSCEDGSIPRMLTGDDRKRQKRHRGRTLRRESDLAERRDSALDWRGVDP